MGSKTLKIALIQLAVGANKSENIQRALRFIKVAADNDSKVVVLPECFNSPYGTQFFPKYAESVPAGETALALSAAAKENNIYLVGGSIPEVDNSDFYNTCTVWNPEGKLVAKHRKVHLFDINVPGGICFKESETLKPGSELTIFDTSLFRVGIGICYDLRFGEMARLYRQKGCHVMLFPAAFNMTTGPPHWELLLRSRAVDTQTYVAGIAPAQDKNANYVSYGHTLIADPWGKVIEKAGFEEDIIYAEIDSKYIESVRQQIPVFSQRRVDLYDTVFKS